MNKVKYPDKKVIQQQICTIIDRSGMFDEQQDSQMFTEIKPVSRKHSYTRTAFKVVKAAAAAAAAVIVVGSNRNSIKEAESISTGRNTGK